MFIYSLKKQFDPNTGEEIEPTIKPCGKICDYSGELIDPDDDENKPMYATRIDYDNGCEPEWYYDDEFTKLEEMGVDYQDFARFIEGPYHFISHWYGDKGWTDNSVLLVKEWVGSGKPSPFSEYHSLSEVFRAMRYRTLFRLLSKGKYKLSDFGMVEK